MGENSKVPKRTKVLVRRAGDVIPQVVSSILDDVPTLSKEEEETFVSLEAPQHCPACGSPTVVDELGVGSSNTTVGQVIRCGGPSLLCPPRAVGAIAHAFSRDALDVTGLSEARIQQLLEAQILHVPSDLFRLVANRTSKDFNSSEPLLPQIAELPGWGPKSVQNLAKIAERIVTDGITLGRFIYSLGIRHAGQHSSNLIASTYGSVDAFLAAVQESSDHPESEEPSNAFSRLVGTNETEGTKGIGPVLIASLVSFSKEKQLVEAAQDLASAIRVLDVPKPPIGNAATPTSQQEKPWQGLTVVFTGSLPGMSRSQAQEYARELGANGTPGTVSKATDIVVAGDKGGKKLSEAIKLDVRVIEAADFVKLVEEYRKGV